MNTISETSSIARKESIRLTKSERSAEVARLILRSGVIGTYEKEPFVFTSGASSPVYVNIRGLLSQVEAREKICDILSDECAQISAVDGIDILIGGETAGIPFAAIVASKLAVPMAYARKKAKGFGMKQMIEGGDVTGLSAILIEDLTTDGRSKVMFANQIRESGCRLDWTASIFYYGIYPETASIMTEGELSLRYLCEWSDILAIAQAEGGLPVKRIDELSRFLQNPNDWR